MSSDEAFNQLNKEARFETNRHRRKKMKTLQYKGDISLKKNILYQMETKSGNILIFCRCGLLSNQGTRFSVLNSPLRKKTD
ncbi:hypothetical protein [Candidatus Harpocratesius sp.]